MQELWKDHGFWRLNRKMHLNNVQDIKDQENEHMASTNYMTNNTYLVQLLNLWPSAKWKCEAPCSKGRKEGERAFSLVASLHSSWCFYFSISCRVDGAGSNHRVYIDHRCRATLWLRAQVRPHRLCVQSPIWWEGDSFTEQGQGISGGEPIPGMQRGSKLTELLSHWSSLQNATQR